MFSGVAGAQSALIRPTFLARSQGLRLAGGPALGRVSYARNDGFDSHTRYCLEREEMNGRVGKPWQSRQIESLVFVGSNPTSATGNCLNSITISSRGPTATTPLLQRGNGGSIPSGTTHPRRDVFGLQVFRQHASVVRRETEFDSRADLARMIAATGGSSNGKTPALQAGNRGSTPRLSTGSMFHSGGSRIRLAGPLC